MNRRIYAIKREITDSCTTEIVQRVHPTTITTTAKNQTSSRAIPSDARHLLAQDGAGVETIFFPLLTISHSF